MIERLKSLWPWIVGVALAAFAIARAFPRRAGSSIAAVPILRKAQTWRASRVQARAARTNDANQRTVAAAKEAIVNPPPTGQAMVDDSRARVKKHLDNDL